MIKLDNPWFPFGVEAAKPTDHLLFCFHYAGGSAAVFRLWAMSKIEGVCFIPVQLPGRGRRLNETAATCIDELMPELLPALQMAAGERKFSLFGHSMGAAVAFAAACRMQEEGGILPSKLIVAGRHAPHHQDGSPFRSTMDDNALVQELRRINGTPQEILENEEMLAYLLPLIRADYQLHENYAYRGECVRLPVYAHAGTADEDADPKTMRHWQAVTQGAFHLECFEGDHFFVQRGGAGYLNHLARLLN